MVVTTNRCIRFLWVALQISTLCCQISDANIRASLASLPSGLPETYQQILLRIKTESTAKTVSKIFQWVAVSTRPMNLEELREAIAIDSADASFQRDRLVNQLDRLVSWCGDLVTLDEDELVVQFAHHSIKDFLTSSGSRQSGFLFKLSSADNIAGVACITYLNFSDFEQQLVEGSQGYAVFQPADLIKANATSTESSFFRYGARLAGRYQKRKSNFDTLRYLSNLGTGKTDSYLSTLYTRYHFLAYAVENWPKHTRNFFPGNSTEWFIGIKPEYEEQSIRHINLWVEMIVTRHPLATPFWNSGDRETRVAMIQSLVLDFECLSLLCFIDHRQVVEDGSIATVLRNDVDLFAIALEASKRGLWTMFDALKFKYQSLLATKATTRLYVAAETGNLQEVETLRRMGADFKVESSTSALYTPLYLAAENGHLNVVQKLLSAGARVNIIIHLKDSVGREEMAIHGAVRGGHLGVVRCQVQRHLWRSPPADYERFMPSALQSALVSGHAKIVKELFKLGVDLDCLLPDKEGYIGLHNGNIKWGKAIDTLVEKIYGEVDLATFKEERSRYAYGTETCSFSILTTLGIFPVSYERTNKSSFG
jgi:hypothetical protein